MLVFDAETNGFLEHLTKIHCIVIYNNTTEETARYRGDTLRAGLLRLQDAELIAGHNVLAFDIPAFQKVYPWFMPRGKVFDTHVVSRLIYPDIKANDRARENRGPWIERKHIGRHTLASWGSRLGEPKADYLGWCKEEGIDEPFAKWTQELEDYCYQDVTTNVKLVDHLQNKLVDFSKESLELEHSVHPILQRQMARGWAVNVPAMESLYRDLMGQQHALSVELKAEFGFFYKAGGSLTPKRDNKTRGYTKGVKLTKVRRVEFNPGSRQQIAFMLKRRYKWRPKKFTPAGDAQIDEAVLQSLPYVEAKNFGRYLMLEKRMGMIADGKSAWLKYAKYSHNNTRARIHPTVIHNGCVTGRMSHQRPNVAQVTRPGNPYGEEMRRCWIAGQGYMLVGCDAEGIEMRALAHYMSRFDGGAYAKAVVEGKKDDGTDPHSINAAAMGLLSFGVAEEIVRDTGKTVFYAMIYGAGDYRVGLIVLKAAKKAAGKQKCVAVGREVRAKLARNIPALIKVMNSVKAAVRKRGWLRGLDGRRLDIRSEHAAVNALFQSFGAIIMKRALVILDASLQAVGLNPGGDYEFVGNIHDEWQMEAHPQCAEGVGKMATQAIEAAGQYYKVRCKLSGGYAVGENWNDTH